MLQEVGCSRAEPGRLQERGPAETIELLDGGQHTRTGNISKSYGGNLCPPSDKVREPGAQGLRGGRQRPALGAELDDPLTRRSTFRSSSASCVHGFVHETRWDMCRRARRAGQTTYGRRTSAEVSAMTGDR